MQRRGGSRSELRENAQRNALRIDFREGVCFSGIEQKRTVTRGEDFEVTGGGFAGDADEGDETAGVQIAGNGIVDGGESAEESFVGAKIGAGIGAANTRKHGGSNAVSGDVAERNDQAAIRQGFPIVVVATRFIGWLIPTGNGVAGDLRRLFGEKGLLNLAGNLQVMLQAIELAFCVGFAESGFDMFADFAGDCGSDDTGDEQNDGVKADIGLRDGRSDAWNGRSPTEIDGGSEIRNGSGSAGKPTDPGIETKDRKNDEDKKEKSGGRGDRSIGGFDGRTAEPGNPNGGKRGFQDGGGDPMKLWKLFARANGAINEAQHQVFVGGEYGGQGKIPAGVWNI